MATSKMTTQIWAMIFVLAFVWGGSFLFARIAVLEIPPLTLVFLRVAMASMALNLFLMIRPSRHQHTLALWRDFAVMGVINNIIPFGLIFYGQLEIGAGLAAIINAMTPIWTVVVANFLTVDERFTAQKIVGVMLGFSGVAILIGMSALDGLQASTIAQLAVLGATISYAFAGVFGKRFTHIPAVETARGQLTMSGLLIIPLMLLIEQPWQLAMPSQAAIWSVVALAIICTAFAYLLFFEILSRAGAVNVSLVTFLIPPSAIVLGMAVLGEQLELFDLIGMAIIMMGLIVIDGRLLKR